MKRIHTILVISLFTLVVFGRFIPEASAKFILGKALCNPSPEAVREASAYNAFTIGQKIDLSPTEGLTKAMRIEKTVGKVRGETVIKAGFKFEPYIKLRGEKSVAGKIFEESYRRSFNNQKIKLGTMELRAENTAVLGKSHDYADILFYDKNTNILQFKAQLKLSANKAIDAITNLDNIKKYSDCDFVLTPPDQLKHIIQHPPKNPVKAKAVDKAIRSGRLTDNIMGVYAKDMSIYLKENIMLKPAFRKTKGELFGNLSRAIRHGEKSIIVSGEKLSIGMALDLYRETNVVRPEIESALRAARLAKFVKVGDKVVGVAGSVWDIGYGVYMIYNAESQFEKGQLDVDLSNYKKILGVVQIGVGVLGLVAVFSPDPFSKVAVPIVIVVGVLVAALDMWIDHIQAERIAARQRLVERLDAQDRPRAVREFLIKKMNTQCAL